VEEITSDCNDGEENCTNLLKSRSAQTTTKRRRVWRARRRL